MVRVTRCGDSPMPMALSPLPQKTNRMIKPIGVLMLLLACMAPAFKPTARSAPLAAAVSSADSLYHEVGLDGMLDRQVFDSAYASMERRGLRTNSLAIADMSQPSTAHRLFLIDLAAKKLVLRTWVAHGLKSGDLMAERFSNRPDSHQTSRGLYRVEEEINSPKHGAALLLRGLDAGVNDLARAREVIIHGADYVSADFIARHGRLGRSWGCPAVPLAEMKRMIALLANGGLLFVYAT